MRRYICLHANVLSSILSGTSACKVGFNNGYKLEESNSAHLMYVYKEDVHSPHCSHSIHKYGFIEKRITRHVISRNSVYRYELYEKGIAIVFMIFFTSDIIYF